MKISIQWLNDFIDVADYLTRPEELAKSLTAAGFEVESLENPGTALKNVVVGHIVKLERHPNADRLTVCQVDVGDGTIRQIVCGAKNHKAGDKVVVALPGAVLPGNFEIKKSKIRDVESLGMLASESELGLKKESEGILILPADAPVGESFVKYFGLDDVLLEINVSPNRADCLSHLGLAREISAILDRPLKKRNIEIQTTSSLSTKNSVALKIKDHRLCPRYSGRVLAQIKVGPSPDWLKRRLESIGFNSINNVVDITNYVMLEVGQPLHAFDLDQLKGSAVEVDVARKGEKFVSLDGTELTLSGSELTIRDSERAVCIAGVIGSKNSGVTSGTSRIFLESAHFAMDSVRKTSRALGLQTDSSYRFSRGTDSAGVVKALDLACSLLQKHFGAQVASDHYDEYPAAVRKPAITIALKDVAGRLGIAVERAEFADWMKRLGCEVQDKDGVFLVTPPEFRGDLEIKEDLIEEFGRLHGYDRIPEVLPTLSGEPLKHADEYTFFSKLGSILEEEGFLQAVNFGFVSGQFQKHLLGSSFSEAVPVRNPLNEDLNVMRASLVPWLYRNLIYNCRQGMTDGRLFEAGFIFQKSGAEYQQLPRLGLMAWGNSKSLWQKSESPVVLNLKTAIENLCHRLRVGGPKGTLSTISFQSLEFRAGGALPPFLHPGQSATVFCEGKTIGFVGALHPSLLSDEKITVPAAIAELDLTVLGRGQPRPVKFQPISKQPSVERDFAFLVPNQVTAASIATEIRKIAAQTLQSIEVFDVFEGGTLPEGYRSIAYRAVFQDPTRTLTDAELQGLQANIVGGLTKKLGIQVR